MKVIIIVMVESILSIVRSVYSAEYVYCAMFHTDVYSLYHFKLAETSMRLSTLPLKPDSLDLNPQSGFIVVSLELHTSRRLHALHCWINWFSRTVTQHSTQLGSGSRPCGGKVVFGSGSRSKVPCGEPQWSLAVVTHLCCCTSPLYLSTCPGGTHIDMVYIYPVFWDAFSQILV